MKLTIQIGTTSPVIPNDETERVASMLSRAFKGSDVQWRSSDFEPPAAGLSEIAMIIGLIADSTTLIQAIATLASNRLEARRFRKELARITRERKQSQASGRRYVPAIMSLSDGTYPNSVRFFIHGTLTDEDVLLRFRKAEELLNSLPQEVFSQIGGPTEYGFYWDEEVSHWRGQLFTLEPVSDSFYPRDLLSY